MHEESRQKVVRYGPATDTNGPACQNPLCSNEVVLLVVSISFCSNHDDSLLHSAVQGVAPAS